MAANDSAIDTHRAGGRLRLLARAELDAEQKRLSDRLTVTRHAPARPFGLVIRSARHAGGFEDH